MPPPVLGHVAPSVSAATTKAVAIGNGSVIAGDTNNGGETLALYSDDCHGWSCLTDSQKFGIIFSVVVSSVILAVRGRFEIRATVF